MRRIAAIFTMVLALALGGCEFDTTGLDELSDVASQLVAQGQVGFVVCDAAVMVPAQAGVCQASNLEGTLLEYGGIPALAGGWASSAPSVVSITLDGVTIAVSAGVADITAFGTLGSSASFQITVPGGN